MVSLFLALSLSISGLLLFDPLIVFANETPDNFLIYIAVYTFLFVLAPCQFFSAVILLLLHVAAPQSAFFIKNLTRAARFLVSTTLLLAVPLMVHTLFTEATTPDTLMVTFVGAAAAVIYRCNLYERYNNLDSQTSDSFVPEFTALCISMGSFIFIESFSSLSDVNRENTPVPVPIQLLLLSLDCIIFFLAMLLIFFRISVPADGPLNYPKTVGMITNLVEATSAMSFTITVLIALYMFVP